MKVVIIEDEYPAANRLRTLLEKVDAEVEILDVLDSVSGACTWFEAHPSPDLILSDIQLSDGLSFEVFERMQLRAPVIFTTAYDEYAIKAFKLNSIDYLVKPIQVEELNTALNKFVDTRPAHRSDQVQQELLDLLKGVQSRDVAYKERFLVKGGEALVPVFQTEIAYFAASNEITHLVRSDGKRFLVDYTLSDLEERLNPGAFFRANRQYIIQASAIKRVFPYFNGRLLLSLHPQAREDVLVSKSKASRFKQWFDGG